MTRVHLSPPDVGPAERSALLDAFDSGWIAPVGPDLAAFEALMCERIGIGHAVALSSGTAALHLALEIAGVGPGDEVLVPTLTFVATANAVRYTGASLHFVDADPANWCIDAGLVADHLAERADAGSLPAALVTVDLYGLCPDYDRLVTTCRDFGVTLIEDAAEALGSTYRGTPAGRFGEAAIFSFNGNKIITTSGGGMLVSEDGDLVERARHLATQARDPAPHYEHSSIGYNYRLSNLLAAMGVAQLSTLDERVARRRAVNDRYRAAFADLEGIGFMPDPADGTGNCWLTVITVDPTRTGTSPERIRVALETADIEARPAWKPMHLQPVFADVPVVGGSVSEGIFHDALCLPSGSNLEPEDQDRVIAIVRASVLRSAA